MSGLSSKELLAGWLAYLEEQAGELVGNKAKLNILQATEIWSLLQEEEFYCLECPLKGQAGVDFALQYSTDNFLTGNPFTGLLGESYNRLFNLYSQKVGPQKHFYIEVDTGFGDCNKLAIFLELPKESKEAVIRLALGYMGNIGLEKKLASLLDMARDLEPVMLGSMFSRIGAPLRICFGTKEHVLNKPGRLAAMLSFLEKLPKTQNIIADLKEIEQTEFLDCYLDIDILADGSLGPALGLELMCCAHSLEQQHLMLESLQYHKFKELLQRHKLTDERMECLQKCSFYAPLPKVNGQEENLYSMISHFKMSYKDGLRQTAKVYLQGDRGR